MNVKVRMLQNWYETLLAAVKQQWPGCYLDMARWDDSSSTTCAVWIWDCPDDADTVDTILREELNVGGWMEVEECEYPEDEEEDMDTCGFCGRYIGDTPLAGLGRCREHSGDEYE